MMCCEVQCVVQVLEDGFPSIHPLSIGEWLMQWAWQAEREEVTKPYLHRGSEDDSFRLGSQLAEVT